MYISEPFVHFEAPTTRQSPTAAPRRSGLVLLAAVLVVGLAVLLVVLALMSNGTAGPFPHSYAPAHIGR